MLNKLKQSTPVLAIGILFLIGVFVVKAQAAYYTQSNSGGGSGIGIPVIVGNGGTGTSTQVTNGINYYNGTNITSGTTFSFDGANIVDSATNATINIGGSSLYTQTGLQISSTTNNFFQEIIQNLSPGNNASAGLVFNNGSSTQSTYYGEIGINGMGFSSTTYSGESPQDMFIYSSDANLDLETASSTGPAAIKFLTGGANTANIRAIITGTGSVGIGTTSPYGLVTLYGTGSTAALSPQMIFSASTTASGAANGQNNWVVGTDLADGGKFKISSSTVIGSNDRLVLDGLGNLFLGTTSPAANAAIKLQLGNNLGTANGTTTVSMGKIQFDGYDNSGARECVFLVGLAVKVISGACRN